MELELYRHSGRSGVWGIPVASAAGMTAALVLGVVYSLATNWIPIIYVNFLLTALFGAAVGWAVGWGGQLGKVRNNLLTSVLGGLLGLFAVYFAWVFDAPARTNFDWPPLWTAELLHEYMLIGYEEGFWSIGRGGGGNVNGVFLVAVWLVEAGMIVGLSTYVASRVCGKQPFCEHDNQWTTTKVAGPLLFPWEPTEKALPRLLQGDLTALAELIRADDASSDHLRLDLATCSACTESNYLSVQLVQYTVDNKGNPQATTSCLIENMHVAHEDVAKIVEAGRELTEEEIKQLEAESPADIDFAAQRHANLRPRTGATQGSESPKGGATA